MHPDQDVRSEAVHYFVGEFSRDPAIMPLVIQAIETYDFANAFRAYYFLDSLVQTDETVRWLMVQIRSLAFESTEETVSRLRRYISALIHAGPGVLKRFEAEILNLDALTDQEREFPRRASVKGLQSRSLCEPNAGCTIKIPPDSLNG